MAPRSRLVRIRGARRRLEEILDEYRREIYRYNSLIRETGYYLKPAHIVTKRTAEGRRTYVYMGRYWWRIEYRGRRGKTSRIRWVYVGRSKPPELSGYPDPPRHPLEGLRIIVDGDDILIEEEALERYKDALLRLTGEGSEA